MQIVQFSVAGVISSGVMTAEGIADLGAVDPELAAVDRLVAISATTDLAALARSSPVHLPADVRWLPPVAPTSKIFCIGLNYRAHASEAGLSVPDRMSIFLRLADSLTGHLEPIIRPGVSDQFDFEGELAVVIGRGGRHIRKENALHHVGGYSCFADNSVRDFQRHSTQVTPGKNFPSSGAMGPWVATSEGMNAGDTMLRTFLNGQMVQEASTSDMIFPISEAIAYISSWTELRPGDVISTGTPSGVGLGRTPPLWMKPGDRLRIEIEGLGTLENRVQAESHAAPDVRMT